MSLTNPTLSLPAAPKTAGPSPALAPLKAAPSEPLQARAGEIVLTQGQKLALLTMRRSDFSETVLASIIAQTRQGPAGRDFYSVAAIGLAVHKGGFHVLTPTGRWRADRLARDLANAMGMHVLTYDFGGPNRAASSICVAQTREEEQNEGQF